MLCLNGRFGPHMKFGILARSVPQEYSLGRFSPWALLQIQIKWTLVIISTKSKSNPNQILSPLNPQPNNPTQRLINKTGSTFGQTHSPRSNYSPFSFLSPSSSHTTWVTKTTMVLLPPQPPVVYLIPPPLTTLQTSLIDPKLLYAKENIFKDFWRQKCL